MDKNKIWDYTIYLIWAFMLFTVIYDLFNIPARSIFWTVELVASILIYLKTDLPKKVYGGILLIFLLNIFGELYFGFFYTITNFDKWIHLLSPLAACTLFYFLLRKRVKNKKILILLSVSLLLSWELCWEIIEYFFDQHFHTLLAGVHVSGVQKFNSVLTYMDPYEDTIYDMLYNLIGSIVWAFGALFITRKKIKK